MADILTLANSDYTDVGSKVDLVGGTLQYLRGSWLPKAGGSGPVTETIDLVSTAGQAAIIAEVNRIEGLLELARSWKRNPVQASGAWLEWGIEGEPRAAAEAGYASKRCWLYEGAIEALAPKGLPGALMGQQLAARLAITRHPYFENLEKVTDSDASVGWGDVIDLTGLSEMGTAPGRIVRALVYEATTAAYMNEFWLGLRPENMGWSANLEILWELEDGTNGTDASDAVDATASGGDKVVCSFATQTGLVQRVQIQASDVIATNYTDELIGRYLVLLRCKVGSSTEVGLVMRHGGGNEYARMPAEEVYIDHTAWRLVELGEVTVLPQGWRSEYELGVDPEYAAREFTIQIDAERLSGSGSLDMDCLYLIPAEHFIHCRYPDTPADVMAMEAITLPDDSLSLHMWEISNDSYIFAEHAARDWFLPTDVSLGVVAGQTNSGHVLTHDMYVGLEWFPRWNLFRGV